MTAIIKGKIIKTLGTEKAMGGTELIAQRMVDNIPSELLNKFHIIHSRIDNDLISENSNENILVFHDLPQDPMYSSLHNKNFRKKFSKFVAVSNWQKYQFISYFGIKPSEIVTIENSIEPIELVEKNKDTINLIYHTTPHRGLNILIPVFQKLCEKYDNLHLNVYSSFEIYGCKERDKEYKELFKLIKDDKNITNHGTVSNDEIRTALQKTNIFAYPCTWTETSCLSLIEAMSAGVVCIHPDHGVLPETSGRLNIIYNYHEDINNHAGMFYSFLDATIHSYINNDIEGIYKFNKNYIDINHNNKSIFNEKWIPLLTSLQK